MIAAVLMGLGTSGFMTITHTVIHSVVPDEIRGRVASVGAAAWLSRTCFTARWPTTGRPV